MRFTQVFLFAKGKVLCHYIDIIMVLGDSMEKKKLTYEQNIRSAIVFLNTFGLTLEEKDSIVDGDVLKVYNGSKEAGKVSINGEKTLIETDSNFGLLQADYDRVKYFSSIDHETDSAFFARWSTDISYTIKDQEKIKMKGIFTVLCNVDTTFGMKCICQPLLQYYSQDGSVIEFKMQRDGRVFYFSYENKENKEDIQIAPYNESIGYFRHHITKGEFKDDWPYLESYLVTDKSERENNILVAGNYIVENGNRTQYNCIEEKKISKVDEDALLMQKIALIQKVGSKAFHRIKIVRDFFIVDGVSLFDHFINVSLPSYTDEEVKGLLGIDREVMHFQNGAYHVKDAYFGVKENQDFFLLGKEDTSPKRLEKKKI